MVAPNQTYVLSWRLRVYNKLHMKQDSSLQANPSNNKWPHPLTENTKP